MKRTSAVILSFLMLPMLAISACSKKGSSAPAATPPGATDPAQGQNLTDLKRGWWYGGIQVLNRPLFKDVLRSTGMCNRCSFDGATLMVRILDGQFADGRLRGRFEVRAYRNGQWLNSRLVKNVPVVPTPTGFQFNQSIWANNVAWTPEPLPQQGPYWRCRSIDQGQNNRDGWYLGFNVSGDGWNIGGTVQDGQTRRNHREECYEVTPMHQGQQTSPQVINPQDHNAQNGELVIKSDFTDASRTVVRVTLTYMGQVIAQGDLPGHTF